MKMTQNMYTASEQTVESLRSLEYLHNGTSDIYFPSRICKLVSIGHTVMIYIYLGTFRIL